MYLGTKDNLVCFESQTVPCSHEYILGITHVSWWKSNLVHVSDRDFFEFLSYPYFPASYRHSILKIEKIILYTKTATRRCRQI